MSQPALVSSSGDPIEFNPLFPTILLVDDTLPNLLLLEDIFEEGVRSGTLRDSIDCHFAAQAVIGLCNAWGDLIVRNPDLDVFDVIQNCTDLLLNGFSNK